MEREQDDDMKMPIRPRNIPLNRMKMPFMFLPYRLFVKWTNIEKVVRDQDEEDDAAPATDIEVKLHIKLIHRDLHKLNWMLIGLHKLKFTYSTEQRIAEASIFSQPLAKSQRIYNEASDFQRQFLFLPLPLLVHATNIREIAVMLHHKHFPDKTVSDDHLVMIIDQIHNQMHKLNRWQLGYLGELRFLRPGDVAVPVKRNRGRPRKFPVDPSSPPLPVNISVQNEPQPSTSRAYLQSLRSNDITTFSNPRSHSTLLSANGSMDLNDHSSGQLAVSPKKPKITEFNRSVTSNHSSKTKRSNTLNNTSVSATSGTTTQPHKVRRKVLKPSQQDPNDKPTKVQCKTIEMDKSELVKETNIKQLIRRKYGKLTKEECQRKIDYYFSLLPQWDVWNQHDCLKDLELKVDLSVFKVDSDDSAEEVAPKKPEISSETKPGTGSGLADSSKKTPGSENMPQKLSESDEHAHAEPESLYNKLLPLSMDEFVEQTNIEQLIKEEIIKRKATPSFFEQNMKKGIEKIFKVIRRPDVWYEFELMQRLKFVNAESDSNGLSVGAASQAERNVDRSETLTVPISISISTQKKSANREFSNNKSADEPINDGSTATVKREPVQILPNSQAEDDEVICEGTLNESIIVLSDTDNVAPEFEELMNEPANNQSVQVEMSPINDDMLTTEGGAKGNETGFSMPPMSESHDAKTSEANVLPSTSSQVLRASKTEANIIRTDLSTEVSQFQSINSTQYSTQVQCAQQSNSKGVLKTTESQTQLMDNNDSENAAAVDDSNVDIVDITAVPISTSTQTAQETNPNDLETQFNENGNTENLNQVDIIKREPVQILPNSPAEDDEVICEGTLNESIIVLSDTDSVAPEFEELMNGILDSFPIINESNNQEGEANQMTCEDLITTLGGEPSTTETVQAEVVFTTTITTETVMSVKSGFTTRSSTLQRIENTMNAKLSTSNQLPSLKRPIDQTNTAPQITKRSKKTMNDTLSSIQPPKYDYRPLQLINKQANGTVHQTVGQKSTNAHTSEIFDHLDNNATLSSSPQIDSDHGTPPTQASQCDVIEEFDSSCEIDETNAKNQEQSQIQSTAMKILTQDNTWFLNVNTQPIVGGNGCVTIVQPSSTSKQPHSTVNISVAVDAQPVTVNLTEKPITEIMPLLMVPSHLRPDSTFQYLYYVNIEKFDSKLLMKEGEQSLNTNLHLKYQCNGRSRIVVSGESIKYILQVSENEWKTIKHTLNIIGDFAFNMNNPPKSSLHRLIFRLFRINSCFSKAHVTYNEQDLDTARAVHKPYVIDNVDLTPAFDPKFLVSLKKFKNKMVKDQI